MIKIPSYLRSAIVVASAVALSSCSSSALPNRASSSSNSSVSESIRRAKNQCTQFGQQNGTRKPLDTPCIGSTIGTPLGTPIQGLGIDDSAIFVAIGSDVPSGRYCKVATLNTRAIQIANNAMSGIKNAGAGAGTFLGNVALLAKAAAIGDNPLKTQQFPPYGIDPTRLAAFFGPGTTSASQVTLFRLIGKIAPATGTNSVNFVMGTAGGTQMYIQETNPWLSSSYGSMLLPNLADKYFISIYNATGNYLVTLYPTGVKGVQDAVNSMIQKGGIVSDNINPDYDLQNTTITCSS